VTTAEHIGIEIRAIRPADRAELRMDTNAGELLGVSKKRENTPELHQPGHAHLSLHAILEAEVQLVVTGRASLPDVLEHRITSCERAAAYGADCLGQVCRADVHRAASEASSRP
jgi:hypothetical protein